MLNEQERRELKGLAASAAIREEFRRLSAASKPTTLQTIDLDRLLNFLTTMARFGPQPSRPRPFITYTHVRL